MFSLGAKWIEISMVALGALGLLILLAPDFGQKATQTDSGWKFPVKWTCQLVCWLGLLSGFAAVAFGGHRLLSLGLASLSGWAGFALGFALVLLVLKNWPEPLFFDKQGLSLRGAENNRIVWENLSHVRPYAIRGSSGIVFHSMYGRQVVISEMRFNSKQILDVLLESRPVPIHSAEDDLGPISILKAHIP